MADGVLVIDKPQGMTSHDVVDWIRRRLKETKVGHLGTLDPMATGVLPVSIGKATRLAQFMSGAPKEYTGEIRLGFSTTTYDREGEPTSGELPVDIHPDEIHRHMRELTGSLEQTPPPFSAKKVGGVPSYKLARRGKAVELAPARVEVEAFDLAGIDLPHLRFRIVCSPGTYVRSLAHDLGGRLGCGGHLTELRRIRSGDFRLEQSVRLDDVCESAVIPIEKLLPELPAVVVDGAEETKVIHGVRVLCGVQAPLARIFNKRGEFLAVARIENGWALPRVVLTSVTSD